MQDLGYGAAYRYDPVEPHGIAAQRYLPDRLGAERFYRPGDSGYENAVAARMAWWEARRKEAMEGGLPTDTKDGA
jgi:putative ATPase